MPRTTRSTVSSETGSTSADIHASTTCLNPSPEGGDPEAGYVPQGVSTEEGTDPQDLKGHGPQKFRTYGKYYFPQDLPKFDGDKSLWDKFISELVYMILSITGVNLLLAEKPTIADSFTNEYIFQCLSKCVNGTLYDIICRYKGQGFEAFKFLDRTIAGSINFRQTKVVREQANLTCFDNEDMLSYTSTYQLIKMDPERFHQVQCHQSQFLVYWIHLFVL